jgi:cyanophycinase
MAPGPLALVGSGEYLPAMAGIEAGLLEGRPPRYVQLATAAVPDGPQVVARWHALGAEQAARLGAEQVVLPVASRRDADDPAVAAMVAGAGLVYLSGGKPSFLADTLRDTAVWAAIVEAWGAGAALAGCSAGAMAMAAWVPSLRHPRGEGATAGLSLLPHLRVLPHFDAFIGRMPDLATRALVGTGEGVTVVGVDEMTAIVGGPTVWEVKGRGCAWELTGGGRRRIASGEVLVTAGAPT